MFGFCGVAQVLKKWFHPAPELKDTDDENHVPHKTAAGESYWRMIPQMGISLFVAGLGMVGAGILLDEVVTWSVFVDITDMMVLVTPLLGLKGDLEMTLACRLSTHSNLGRMKTRRDTWNICFASLCLDQLQAIVCGFLAAVLAVLLGMIMGEDPISFKNFVLLAASSCMTASIVSLFLGSIMCWVVILAGKFRCNPDNIATPVAGSLGDIVTLGSLALLGSFMYSKRDEYPWIPYAFLAASAIIIPFCGVVAYRNENTRPILKSGWAPVLISVAISSGGGLILEQSSGRFDSLALYQPLINGIGGNIVCILASRLATQVHRDSDNGILPTKWRSICVSPCSTFLGGGIHVPAARILMGLVVPLQLGFLAITFALSTQAIFNLKFILLFEAACILQLLVLLYVARILVNACWKLKWDPDTNSVPYLTALGDLLGSGLLLLAFILYEI